MAKALSSIQQQLQNLRRTLAVNVLLTGIFRLALLLIVAAFLLILLEGWRYFPPAVRTQIVGWYIILASLFSCLLIVLWYLIRQKRLRTFDDVHLARRIAAADPLIRDELLNALQLWNMMERQEKGFSKPLVERTLEEVAGKLKQRDLNQIVPVGIRKRAFRDWGLITGMICLIVLFNPGFFGAAGERLLHPRNKYSIPLPFAIRSLTANQAVLGGDSLTLKFACSGRVPVTLQLNLIYPDYQQQAVLPVDSMGQSCWTIPSIRQDIIYEAFVENHSPFIPWRKITSGQDTIRVINRPEILRVRIQVTPPAYTGLPTQVQESNNAELIVLKGTRLEMEVMANKPIKNGYLKFSHQPNQPLICQNTRARVAFNAKDDDDFAIIINDEKGVSNADPLKYHLRLQSDAYPTITLLSPKTDFDLTEEMTIPLGIRISDDFGFTRAVIRYRLLKKYAESKSQHSRELSTLSEPDEREIIFPLRQLDNTLQELYFAWQIGDLNLGPEDAVEFRVEIYDNDILSGPKKATTPTIQARFPSLNELFSATNSAQDEIIQNSSEISEQLQRTKQILEEVARELLKKPDLQWEQKKQLESEIQKTREAGEKLAQLGKKVEELIQKSKENQLWNAETLAKYAQLQEAYQQIMTPELKDALRQLQQALEKMDSKEVQQALSNFKLNQQQFSQELDRLLQIFKRIKIEQAVDELVKRFNDLAQRQSELDRKLSQTAPENSQRLTELAEEQKALRQDTEIARDVLERTTIDMAEFPLMPTRELQQIADELRDMAVTDLQNQAQKALQKGNKADAAPKTQQSARQLQSLAASLQQFRQEFSKRTMEEVLSDFQRVLNKTLQLSQMQEKLQNKIAQTPRQSEQIMDVAVKQSEVYQNLSNILTDLIQLSNKTFGVTPRIGKGMGEAATSMRNVINSLEERNPATAGSRAAKATTALNQAALEILAAMNQLKQSGSASGFENYLEQLRQMAGAQQGLNAETQMLGLSGSGDQLSLQRLAARQQQIKQSLEQLQQEIQGKPTQAGDLGGIAQDMEEVIKDLQNNQLLRRTIERQQRILSRLLDAQQSLRTQDYKEERISKTGEDVARQTPANLPANLGARRNLLQENLERALREGYRREYQDLIRRYFQTLSPENPK